MSHRTFHLGRHLSCRRHRRGFLPAAACVVLLAGCGSSYSTEQLLDARGSVPATGAAAAGPAAAPRAAEVSAGTEPGTPAIEPGSSGVTSTGASAPRAGGDGRVGQPAKDGTAGLNGKPGSAGSSPTCTKPGAPLILGQVGAWSGLVGQSAGGARTGLAVWANLMNAKGGLACHPIRLTSVDDQSDGAKASAAVNDLVQNKKAVALIGSMVPIDAAAYRSAIEANKVPTIGGDYVSEEWLKSPYMYPVGGGPEAVYTIAVKGAVTQGKKNIATIHCVEAAACSYGKNITTRNAASVGGTIVYSTSVSLTQSDFTSQCQNARSAKADAIAYFGDGASVHRLARSCNNLGYNPLLLIGSLAAIDSLRTDPNANKGGLLFAPNVFPWMLNSSAAEKEYHAAYERYAPRVPTDAAGATGWTSGKMLEAVIAALGQEAVDNPITTALILKGLGKIKNESLGGLIPATSYSFNQANATPVQCAYVAVLTSQVWQALLAGKPQCMT